MTHADRGQLVLLAGVTVALALAALLGAYLQLGYHGDVTASAVDDDPVRNGQRVLDRATHVAAREFRGEYTWGERTALVTELRAALDPRLEVLEGARAEAGVAYRATYNATAASRLVDRRCPGGPGRAFGPCVADRGVALQRRGDRAHVLAVGFDLSVTTDESRTRVTVLVNATG